MIAFQIVFTVEAASHPSELTARQRGIALDAISEQLTHEPLVETRNRKLLRTNRVASLELRIDDLRVFCDVSRAPDEIVTIAAIAQKIRNRYLIGGEEVEV